jgi:hypothetical protein
MSLSPEDISSLLKSVAPIQIETNKTINSLLVVKRWGFYSLSDALGSATLTTPDQLKQAVKLAIALSELDFHLVERAVQTAGIEKTDLVLKKVVDLVKRAEQSIDVLADNRDALFTVDGLRRTPGGIFWRFLKNEISKEEAKFVFKDNTKRQQGLRRKLVREKWTENHLTILKVPANKKLRADEAVKTVKDIAAELSMSEVSIIERLVVKKSAEYARAVLKEVSEAMTKDLSDPYIKGLMTVEGERRRTPGGVFAQLVKGKSDISEGDKKFIFAKATGGRAPSMSDLMSMSLALQDRSLNSKPVIVNKSKSSKNQPVEEEEWEFQRKVGNTWEPGFVGQENYAEPIPELEVSDNDPVDEIFSQIMRGLKLDSVEFVERVHQVCGLPLLVQVYRDTVVAERAGGLPISASNPRKRTPKGVFIALLRKTVGDEKVENEVLKESVAPAASPQVMFESSSKFADSIIVELERLRVSESDLDIIRTVVSIKGEHFVINLFEKVRKRFNKGKWLDTPGQLFGKMLKIGLTNDELNQVFESTRVKQLAKNKKKAAIARRPTILLSPSEDRCVTETAVGLALIGVTASEVATMERIVSRLDEQRVLRMLKRTREIEREGGQRTRDQQRRKTPNGVFMSLLSTEEKVSKDDLKFILEKQATSVEERKKEDTHFAPSLFTPINPLRVIDQSGRDSEFIERVKKQIRPTLAQLEYISVLDPRLETVIRGVVLLGPSAIHLIDQCVYAFGEKRTEGWLEISHAQVADSKAAVETLPEIYGDLVKAAGGLPPLETSAGVRC